MWKIYLTLCLLISGRATSLAQLELIELGQFEAKAELIRSTGQESLYLIDEFSIHQLQTNGEPINSNSLKQYGKISSVDAGNGLKFAVFFRDFQQLIYLDNELSNRGDRIATDIDPDLFIQEAAISYNNGLWIYDNREGILKRFDQNFQESDASGSLLQQIGFVPEAYHLCEFNNQVYLTDADQGVLVFNRFGRFEKRIPVTQPLETVPTEIGLFILTKSNVLLYDFKSGMMTEILKSEGQMRSLTIIRNHAYILFEKHVVQYELRLND